LWDKLKGIKMTKGKLVFLANILLMLVVGVSTFRLSQNSSKYDEEKELFSVKKFELSIAEAQGESYPLNFFQHQKLIEKIQLPISSLEDFQKVELFGENPIQFSLLPVGKKRPIVFHPEASIDGKKVWMVRSSSKKKYIIDNEQGELEALLKEVTSR
jgi:hypothetical protein